MRMVVKKRSSLVIVNGHYCHHSLPPDNIVLNSSGVFSDHKTNTEENMLVFFNAHATDIICFFNYSDHS